METRCCCWGRRLPLPPHLGVLFLRLPYADASCSADGPSVKHDCCCRRRRLATVVSVSVSRPYCCMTRVCRCVHCHCVTDRQTQKMVVGGV